MGAGVVDALKQAYCDVMLALSAWRAARDVEAQVAHWCVEGGATSRDLAAARARTKAAHTAHASARRRYARVSAHAQGQNRAVARGAA